MKPWVVGIVAAGAIAAGAYGVVTAAGPASRPTVAQCKPPGTHPKFIAILLQGINSSLAGGSRFDPASVSYCAWPYTNTSGPPDNPVGALQSLADGWLNYSYDDKTKRYDVANQPTIRPRTNLIDQLAEAGGYVLPFSYVEQPGVNGAG